MEIFRKKATVFVVIFCCSMIILLTIFSIPKKGDYQYDIYMNDGTIVHAWTVNTHGNPVYVEPARGEGDSYYLSQTQFTKIVYVGRTRKKLDK